MQTTISSTDLLTFPEVARLLRVHESSLEDYLRDERCDIPRPFKIGCGRGVRRWRAKDMHEYIRAKAVAAAAGSEPLPKDATVLDILDAKAA